MENLKSIDEFISSDKPDENSINSEILNLIDDIQILIKKLKASEYKKDAENLLTLSVPFVE
jgi:hypothetical protein